jgi:hypothetical protein
MRCQLYGIEKTNLDDLLTKNIFTTYLPVSTALYEESKGVRLKLISCVDSGLTLDYTTFHDVLGVAPKSLGQIEWMSTTKVSDYDKSKGNPGIDMVPRLNGSDLTEFEVKLTVVPTYNEEKTTEMIVRQNTQFALAERLCYRYSEYFSSNPTIDEMKSLLRRAQKLQRIFILQGVWKTVGHTPKIDPANSLDVFVITDLAYLHMLLNARHSRGPEEAVQTRIARVLNLILSWIKEYKTQNRLTYKEAKQGSKDHLKITLYITDHLPELKRHLLELRLNKEDLGAIVPRESIIKLSPERRLDASLRSLL